MTLKTGLGFVQGHWKWHHLIDSIRVPITYFGSNRPSLRLGADTVTASEHVHLLVVMISSDLSLEKHVDTVCSKCFFWMR